MSHSPETPLNDLRSPAALLASRRSGKAQELIDPGPDKSQLSRIFQAAIRVPDHGNLRPWRFVLIPGKEREMFLRLASCALRDNQGVKTSLSKKLEIAVRTAPCFVTVISTPNNQANVPLWEQELSAGAACLTLLLAASTEGFVGSWITGPAAYAKEVVAGLGFPGRQIAGFLFIGSSAHPLLERPRPDISEVLTEWSSDVCDNN